MDSWHGKGDIGLAGFVGSQCELDGHDYRVESVFPRIETDDYRVDSRCQVCGVAKSGTIERRKLRDSGAYGYNLPSRSLAWGRNS